MAVRGWKVVSHARVSEVLTALKRDDVVKEFVDQHVNGCRQCVFVIRTHDRPQLAPNHGLSPLPSLKAEARCCSRRDGPRPAMSGKDPITLAL